MYILGSGYNAISAGSFVESLSAESTLMFALLILIFGLNIILAISIYKLARKFTPSNSTAGVSAPVDLSAKASTDSQSVSDDELVAVISAALVAYSDSASHSSTYPGFRVKSIRRV